jgi:hypothetical protein
MGVRVVVRNSSGYVQATLAKVVSYIVDPILAETVVAWQLYNSAVI